MPAKPARRRANPDAGPTITDDRTVVAVPAPTPNSAPAKPRKFTALLDADTDTRYGHLLDQARTDLGPIATRQDGNGRTRAGYDVSRADLLRALLEVAEDDETVRTAVLEKVSRHYGSTS